jgi:hypothetical protein
MGLSPPSLCRVARTQTFREKLNAKHAIPVTTVAVTVIKIHFGRSRVAIFVHSGLVSVLLP